MCPQTKTGERVEESDLVPPRGPAAGGGGLPCSPPREHSSVVLASVHHDVEEIVRSPPRTASQPPKQTVGERRGEKPQSASPALPRPSLLPSVRRPQWAGSPRSRELRLRQQPALGRGALIFLGSGSLSPRGSAGRKFFRRLNYYCFLWGCLRRA